MNHEERRNRHGCVSVLSCLAIVLVWWVAAVALDVPVILPAPDEVLRTTIGLFGSKTFLSNIGGTVLRALYSFVLITLCGTLCGVLAGRFVAFRKAIAPLVALFKATPVMSVILLAFIWLGTSAVPVFSAFLMAFPVMFVQTMDAYSNIDEKLEQMCMVYGIEGPCRMKYLIIPSMMPQILTGARQTLSMVWKVVIAAEVIVLPKYGIGRSLQLAQIQLETNVVLAWTIVAVLLTALGDAAFDLLIGKSSRRRPLR